MRNYRNTQAAKALIFYMLTENIDYRYPIEEEAPKEAKDFDSMLNCMEGSIRHARYRLKKLFEKARKSDWDEDDFFDRVGSVKIKFSKKIPILTAMHADHQDNTFDKFVREPVKEKYEKELKAELKLLLENTLPKPRRLLEAIVQKSPMETVKSLFYETREEEDCLDGLALVFIAVFSKPAEKCPAMELARVILDTSFHTKEKDFNEAENIATILGHWELLEMIQKFHGIV